MCWENKFTGGKYCWGKILHVTNTTSVCSLCKILPPVKRCQAKVHIVNLPLKHEQMSPQQSGANPFNCNAIIKFVHLFTLKSSYEFLMTFYDVFNQKHPHMSARICVTCSELL